MIAAFVLVAFAFQEPQGYRIAPVDDTDRDPAFRSFAAKLNRVAVE